MDELVQRIAAETGLDEATARQAVGIIVGFLKDHAPAGPVGDLIKAIPGADAAVAAAGDVGGGLLGGIGGMMGGAGGLMALAGKLSGAGLDMGQMRGAGREIFQYAKDKIGEERLGEIAASVPGLGQMI
jgi:hypothetical protein